MTNHWGVVVIHSHLWSPSSTTERSSVGGLQWEPVREHVTRWKLHPEARRWIHAASVFESVCRRRWACQAVCLSRCSFTVDHLIVSVCLSVPAGVLVDGTSEPRRLQTQSPLCTYVGVRSNMTQFTFSIVLTVRYQCICIIVYVINSLCQAKCSSAKLMLPHDLNTAAFIITPATLYWSCCIFFFYNFEKGKKKRF